MADIDWKLENQKKQTAVEEAHREIKRLRAALRAVRDEIIYGGGEFEEPCIDKIYDFANKGLKNDGN